MPESTAVRTKRDLVIVIQDDGAAHTPYTVTKEVGDFSYEAPLYDLLRIRDAGELDQARKGDDQPVTVSWTQHLRDIGHVSGNYATIVDITEEKGYVGSTWTSTQANLSDVKAWDQIVTVDGTFAGEADKSMTFADMVFRGSKSFGYPAQIAVTGESITSTKPTVA